MSAGPSLRRRTRCAVLSRCRSGSRGARTLLVSSCFWLLWVGHGKPLTQDQRLPLASSPHSVFQNQNQDCLQTRVLSQVLTLSTGHRYSEYMGSWFCILGQSRGTHPEVEVSSPFLSSTEPSKQCSWHPHTCNTFSGRKHSRGR